MNDLLIDTNVYTQAMRGESSVAGILRRAPRVAISAISIGELLAGFLGGANERRNREDLAEFLDLPRVELLALTERTAEFYAGVLTSLRQAGTPVPTNDVWIAACALEHGLHLYTLDQHFTRIPGLLLR